MNPTAKEIRQARQAAGLTTAEAAKLVDTTQRGWQYWEKGERNMQPAKWKLFQILTSKP